MSGRCRGGGSGNVRPQITGSGPLSMYGSSAGGSGSCSQAPMMRDQAMRVSCSARFASTWSMCSSAQSLMPCMT
ncbi:MAG: hypothetical protein QOJ44_254 [Acidimicrobiaceae bacterium]|nr:hypothetical protein [Acidimicrobiaceae bacterium]